MTKFTTLFSLLTVVSTFSAPGFASQREVSQEMGEYISPPTVSSEADKATAESASRSGVITTPTGEVLGAVIDFIFDLRANHVLYAVGVLQAPEEGEARVIILPWAVLELANDSNSFILKKEHVIFQKAPNFSLETWLNLQPTQWPATIDKAWKEKDKSHSEPSLAAKEGLYRASDLVDRMVHSVSGEEVGALAELLIDPEEGSIAYAIVSLSGSEADSEILFYPLPWSTLQVDPVQLTFVVPDLIEKKLHDPSFLQVELRLNSAAATFPSENIYH